MNRAEIVAELQRIAGLLEGCAPDDAPAEARRALRDLGEAIRLGDLFDPAGCPFEPGTVHLVGLQARGKAREKKKTTRVEAPRRPLAERARRGDGGPLTGRIADMVRGGVPTGEIVALYRIGPEHVPAFVAAYVTPARQGQGAGDEAVTRCPTPP